MSATGTYARVIPAMRYRHAPEAMMAVQSFGFQRHLIVPAPDGGSNMRSSASENSMIMLAAVGSGEFDRPPKRSDEIDKAETRRGIRRVFRIESRGTS